MGNGSAKATVGVFPLPIDWKKGALCIAVVGLSVYAYWGQHVEHELTCWQWLVIHWSRISNYSHGPLIPLIASFLLWWNLSEQNPKEDWTPYWRAMGGAVAVLMIWIVGGSINKNWEDEAYFWSLMLLPLTIVWQVWALRGHLVGKKAPPAVAGPALVAVAMVIYYLGVKAVQPRIVVISGIVLLYGLALTFYGRDVFRWLFFPITFLFLMVPLNFLDNMVGFPLRMFVAKVATGSLNAMGIEAIQRGSGIIAVQRVSGVLYPRFSFDVADPCSGIRSLMALTTVTAAYGYVTQRAIWKRWFLFLCAMPLAVMGNLARVISIALVAQIYGQKTAIDVYHEWSGFILFPVALALMVFIGFLLNVPFGRIFRNWFKAPPPPPAKGPEDDGLPSAL
ncbi:MAG TPA: exosortase/archaeosortase family protein [Verrucomicrobiae bacterium]|nr:exosortase/archaeosortase family protein [Verrucomicrobiae bacterium]